jgi:hypothetical protein
MDEGESVSWSPSTGAVSDRHPLKRMISRNPLWKYISGNVPIPFIITEIFFGAWMSCVAVNLIGGFANPSNPDIVLYAVMAAFSVNIIWGIIDGWSYNMCVTIATSEDDRMIYRLLNNENDSEAKEHLMASLDGGPAGHLSYEEKERLLGTIVASGPDVHPKKIYKFRKGEHHVMISFIIIDVLLATFTVLPFLILNDLTTAMIISRTVTISAFACVAYLSAKYMNRNWVLWVAVMSILGMIIAQMTFLYS